MPSKSFLNEENKRSSATNSQLMGMIEESKDYGDALPNDVAYSNLKNNETLKTIQAQQHGLSRRIELDSNSKDVITAFKDEYNSQNEKP